MALFACTFLVVGVVFLLVVAEKCVVSKYCVLTLFIARKILEFQLALWASMSRTSMSCPGQVLVCSFDDLVGS